MNKAGHKALLFIKVLLTDAISFAKKPKFPRFCKERGSMGVSCLPDRNQLLEGCTAQMQMSLVLHSLELFGPVPGDKLTIKDS